MSSSTNVEQSAPDVTEEAGKRLVITLTAAPAAFTRRLAAKMGVSAPEAVRRALAVMDLVTSLSPDEELLVRNRKTRETERIHFHWKTIG